MQPEEVYESWAPGASAWSLWARPVLFAQMAPGEDPFPPTVPSLELDAGWLPAAGSDAGLVVDLAGDDSVRTGLALAARGYRPVPLFNACTDLHEVIDQLPILLALRSGTRFLRSLDLSPGAPPAFLLDARRMSPEREVRPGAFDNRWQVYPQDCPSAEALKTRGVARMVLIQRRRRLPRPDLADVLRGWQNGGITLLSKDLDDFAPPIALRVEPRPWYRVVWDCVLDALGLRRSPTRGFGHIVREPSHG